MDRTKIAGKSTGDELKKARLEKDRETQVSIEMNALNSVVADLEHMADVLIGRLSPILRTGDNEKPPAGVDPVLVDLAEAIRSRRNRIERIVTLLSDAGDNLEL